MLSRIWNFVKRHKRKFVYTGLLVGGVYYLGKYVKRKIIEQQKKDAMEFFNNIRKRQHYENSQRTCDRTIISMLPNLREAMCKEMDTEDLLKQLKSKPDMKLMIWEDLKILSFTRTITATYACCLLVLLLKTQFNMLAGLMFRNANDDILKDYYANEGDDDGGDGGGDGGDKVNNTRVNINERVQKRYLQSLQVLLDSEAGLQRIKSDVTAAVSDVIGGLSLKSHVTPSSLHDLLTSIRRKIEVKVLNGYHDNELSGLVEYMCGIIGCDSDGGGGEQDGGGGEQDGGDGGGGGEDVDADIGGSGGNQISGNVDNDGGNDWDDDDDDGGGGDGNDGDVLQTLRGETIEVIRSKHFYTLTTICLDSLFNRLLTSITDYFEPDTIAVTNDNNDTGKHGTDNNTRTYSSSDNGNNTNSNGNNYNINDTYGNSNSSSKNTNANTSINSGSINTNTSEGTGTDTKVEKRVKFNGVSSNCNADVINVSNVDSNITIRSISSNDVNERCNPDRTNGRLTSPSSSSSSSLSKPLAKVIPIVNGLVFLLTSDPPNKFIDALIHNDHVQNFSNDLFNQWTIKSL